MDNLMLLSTVALAAPAKKKVRKPNPRCSKPGHSSWNKESIQRHTCSRCFKERVTALFSNPNLTRWDVACILVREFRNYFCCFCILQNGPSGGHISLSKYCQNGHRRICQERCCVAHDVRLTVCRECPDPRAGTSFHFCGKRLAVKCNCEASDIGDQPQDPEIVALKEKYSESLLQRAHDMEFV